MVEGAHVNYVMLGVEMTAVVEQTNVRIGQKNSHISVAQKVRQNTLVVNDFRISSNDL